MLSETQAPLCHVCLVGTIRELPAFRQFRRVTSDCRPWPAGGCLAVCDKCAAVQAIVDDAFHAEAADIYAGYKIYSQSQGAEQAVFESSGAAFSRSRRLLTALKSKFPLPAKGRMLDVGCGNGAMLRAFRDAAPQWTLAGTEIDDKYRAQVEAIPDTEKLYTCWPNEVPGEFNLISLIHVLEHIPGPKDFLIKVRPKLAAGGTLLVELPYYPLNPFELMIADHCTHFTAPMASTVLQWAGYETLSSAEDWVPKELSVVARVAGSAAKAPASASADPARIADGVNKQLHWLRKVADTARQLSKNHALGLFGTSIAATWLYSELQGAVSFFVDEDPNRVGQKWMDKPIYHPSQVPSGSRVFVVLPHAIASGIVAHLGTSAVEYHLPPNPDS